MEEEAGLTQTFSYEQQNADTSLSQSKELSKLVHTAPMVTDENSMHVSEPGSFGPVHIPVIQPTAEGCSNAQFTITPSPDEGPLRSTSRRRPKPRQLFSDGSHSNPKTHHVIPMIHSPHTECIQGMMGLSVHSPSVTGQHTRHFMWPQKPDARGNASPPFLHTLKRNSGSQSVSTSSTPVLDSVVDEHQSYDMIEEVSTAADLFRVPSPALEPLPVLSRSLSHSSRPYSYPAPRRPVSQFRPILHDDDRKMDPVSPPSSNSKSPILGDVPEHISSWSIDDSTFTVGQTQSDNYYVAPPLPPPRCKSVGPKYRRCFSDSVYGATFERPSRKYVANPFGMCGDPLSRSCREEEKQITHHVHKLPTLECSSIMKRISTTTVAKLLQGEFASLYDKHYIIDCRYEFEYQGGHIQGSMNIRCQKELTDFLFSQPPTDGSRIALIFHCEFSKQRGPRACEYIRRKDRQIKGVDNFPNLFYPEMYVMHGGYKEFFHNHPEWCEPRNYIAMVDPRFGNELKLQKSEDKVLWGKTSP